MYLFKKNEILSCNYVQYLKPLSLTMQFQVIFMAEIGLKMILSLIRMIFSGANLYNIFIMPTQGFCLILYFLMNYACSLSPLKISYILFP